MTDATMEAQIERAIRQINFNEPFSCIHHVEQAMRDLLAGKFKDEPLPEIYKPWLGGSDYLLVPTADGKVFVSGHLLGPACSTKRAAIEAWNAVFTKRDER